ncbi:hypothetical protein ACTXT7_012635 [Hymenolepis weldensis]
MAVWVVSYRGAVKLTVQKVVEFTKLTRLIESRGLEQAGKCERTKYYLKHVGPDIMLKKLDLVRQTEEDGDKALKTLLNSRDPGEKESLIKEARNENHGVELASCFSSESKYNKEYYTL